MTININVETYKKGNKKYVFICSEESSGCTYDYKTNEQLKELVDDYINNIIDYNMER